MHPIELLDDVCHMESCIGLFGDSVSLGARLVHGLCTIGSDTIMEAWFCLFGDSSNLDAR